MTRDCLAAAAHQLRRLYNICLPNPCFLCTAPVPNGMLCTACEADLPVLGSGCLRCATLMSAGGICGQCLQKLPPQDETFCLLPYQSQVNKLVAAYKFPQQLGLRDFFAKLMADNLQTRNDLPQLLIPVPLHSRRLRQRGYNQSAELTDWLG